MDGGEITGAGIALASLGVGLLTSLLPIYVEGRRARQRAEAEERERIRRLALDVDSTLDELLAGTAIYRARMSLRSRAEMVVSGLATFLHGTVGHHGWPGAAMGIAGAWEKAEAWSQGELTTGREHVVSHMLALTRLTTELRITADRELATAAGALVKAAREHVNAGMTGGQWDRDGTQAPLDAARAAFVDQAARLTQPSSRPARAARRRPGPRAESQDDRVGGGPKVAPPRAKAPPQL